MPVLVTILGGNSSSPENQGGRPRKPRGSIMGTKGVDYG